MQKKPGIPPADRQSNFQCPDCGSWHRSGSLCNICGKLLPADVESDDDHYHVQSTGRQWSKSKHRYLTAAEIAAGERGG